ncbi:hypothetical protein N7516_009918 [Penicillium verrucosum]|uniref:uncharacterized protein n=1 Tax=Penicillium verrucosum TaxID=60171 RepID=UPI0025453726|nr:uncharacterized protein N7516_009918 [Penicillium verrucosum]KAJ5922215.1 hypothetical protein N7516_009918 [Penicillium verrucosum]
MARCFDWRGNEDPARIPCSQDGSLAQCCSVGGGGNGVKSCTLSTFCCFGHESSCDCNNATETFSLGEIYAVTTITRATASPSSTVALLSTSTIAKSDSSATLAPPESTGDTESDDDLGLGLGVGLGVGIPLLIGALAAFWFFRRRQRRAAARSVPNGAAAPSLRDKMGPSELELTVPMTMQQRPPQELPTRQARAPLELQ